MSRYAVVMEVTASLLLDLAVYALGRRALDIRARWHSLEAPVEGPKSGGKVQVKPPVSA